MARFRWHADYFDALHSGRCVRRSIIPADNAGEAEKIARADMRSCLRVEVRRVATAAPIRVIRASAPEIPMTAQPAGIFSFAAIPSPRPIVS
jgi:hypothetical protein